MLWSSQSNSSGSQTTAVLDHLGKAGTQFPVGQRGQGVGVRDDGERLIEGADQVLAARMIDPGLAADRGIDLGEQRRRHLHIADAALIAGRGEARDVARPRRRPRPAPWRRDSFSWRPARRTPIRRFAASCAARRPARCIRRLCLPRKAPGQFRRDTGCATVVLVTISRSRPRIWASSSSRFASSPEPIAMG